MIKIGLSQRLYFFSRGIIYITIFPVVRLITGISGPIIYCFIQRPCGAENKGFAAYIWEEGGLLALMMLFSVSKPVSLICAYLST
jgi:hypothetical protein